MTRDEVLGIFLSTRVVAVIRMSEIASLAAAVESIRAGGVRVVEITMTTPGALQAIRSLASEHKNGLLVGAGTVLDSETAAAAVQAGADFVVSPVLVPDIVGFCREAGKLVSPGAFTPTEILAAWRAGADIVKVFPATSLGPGYLKDIHGPLPEVRLMPTGGVTLDNARAFIDHGACCVGIGTALLDRAVIAAGDWPLLTDRARRLIKSVSET